MEIPNAMNKIQEIRKRRQRTHRQLAGQGSRRPGHRKSVKPGFQQDAWKLIGVNVTCRIMKDTGHEFNEPQMEIVGEWLRNEVVNGSSSRTTTASPEQ